MNTSTQTHETFRITLIAASPAATLAADFVAGRLGIEPWQAEQRLAAPESVLCDDMPGPQARSLAALLSALGLQVRLDPALSPKANVETLWDLSLHAAEGAETARLAARLSRLTERDAAALADALAEPSGVVVEAVTGPAAAALCHALRRERQLWLVQSARETAVHDLFAQPTPHLRGEIARLGLGPCRFSGALAGGLNHATASHLMRQLGGSVTVVNRAFQRFDLVLWDAPETGANDLADFLAARTGSERPFGRQARGLRIESDLTRRAAEQFVADYAAMGLDVRARLRGRLQPQGGARPATGTESP